MSKVVPLEGFGGGGSSPLNFKIVAYATEEELAAAQPKENTIGVITTTPISSWTFSAKKPFNTDTYDKYIVKNANTVLGVISGRTYTKTNDGIAAFAFIDNGSYVGPMLVSPIQDNAGYITSGNHDSTQTAEDKVVYNGTTYYYPSGAWMGGATLDGLTPSFSANSNAEAALKLAEIYENALAEKEEVSKYEGTVWFSTDVSSVGEFNALKKNSIQLCPTSAKQYINGDWIDKTAKSYQNGNWIGWTIYLYNTGDECLETTGGWTSISKRASFSNTSQSNAPALGKGRSNTLTMTGVTNSGGIIYTKNKITITGKQKLVLDANVITSTTDAGQMVLRIWSELGTYHDDNTVASMAFTGNNAKDGLYYLDISSLDDGDYYIGFTFHGSVSKQIVMRSMALM